MFAKFTLPQAFLPRRLRSNYSDETRTKQGLSRLLLSPETSTGPLSFNSNEDVKVNNNDVSMIYIYLFSVTSSFFHKSLTRLQAMVVVAPGFIKAVVMKKKHAEVLQFCVFSAHLCNAAGGLFSVVCWVACRRGIAKRVRCEAENGVSIKIASLEVKAERAVKH